MNRIELPRHLETKCFPNLCNRRNLEARFSAKSESGVCVCVWIRGENSKEAPNKGHADTRRIVTLWWFTFSIPTLMARQNSGVSVVDVVGRAENGLSQRLFDNFMTHGSPLSGWQMTTMELPGHQTRCRPICRPNREWLVSLTQLHVVTTVRDQRKGC